MSECYFDSQTPIYRNVSKTNIIKLDVSLNQIEINNTTIPKKIIINSQEFSNGTQTLTYVDMYEKINGCASVVYPAPNSTTLSVNNTLELSNGTQTATYNPNSINITSSAVTPVSILIQGDTTPLIPAQLVVTDNTTTACGIELGTNNAVFSADISNNKVALLKGGQVVVNDNTNPLSIVNSTTLSETQLVFNNTAVAPYMAIDGSNRFTLYGNSAPIGIDSGSTSTVIGDINLSTNQTVLTINDDLKKIDQNAVITSLWNNIATLPVSFTSKYSGSINYSTSGSWEEIFHYSIPMPAIAVDPSQTYNAWRLDFSLNCRNMTNTEDKAMAMYFILDDQVPSTYTPFLYNLSTPYTRHSNTSSYSNTATAMQSYNWSDYVDLTGVNGSVPLEFRLNWFLDNTCTCDYDMLISFTRTNMI